jgi:hypothetical protein
MPTSERGPSDPVPPKSHLAAVLVVGTGIARQARYHCEWPGCPKPNGPLRKSAREAFPDRTEHYKLIRAGKMEPVPADV